MGPKCFYFGSMSKNSSTAVYVRSFDAIPLFQIHFFSVLGSFFTLCKLLTFDWRILTPLKHIFFVNCFLHLLTRLLSGGLEGR